MSIDRIGPMYRRNRVAFPANHRSFDHPHHHRRRDRSPASPLSYTTAHRRSNFVIELRSQNNDHDSYNRHEIVSLMGKFKCSPDHFFLYNKGIVAARFFYQQWPNALETFLYLWRVLLDGGLSFMPKLVQNMVVASDTEELNSRLRVLFRDQILGFMDGELVKNWEKKLETVSNEIAKLDLQLKKPKRLSEHMELSKQKEGNVWEETLIWRRIREFKCGMECLIDYLDGKVFDSSVDKVLMLNGNFDWGKLYWLIKRECRRLDDGLPIYADRTDILWQIHCQQVMVLIGETGSGKSTQLVQYLADSAVAADKAIVCTQPRKLAAMSLANRVQEETRGCIEDNSVIFSSTYSSFNQSASKVIYMTDHCLLQHYMSDKNLSWISCIIVDEAHERSLNTDLLLALIKDLLQKRSDLRLIIMSATADAQQLAKYFYNCGTFHVVGRTFPVDITYVPPISNATCDSNFVAPYVSDVVKRVGEIHRMEEKGTILAFLTSQIEVEWACEHFIKTPSIVALPLHGKLSHEEQYKVYLNYPDKRKVIFSTNLAETSLTIPGVKYVVDCGMVKESRFEPGTGMNVLRVCKVSQSSANQRAGRAGRTEPGKCYRIYEENDFQCMLPHQEPEIRRVNLGIAVLRILALGIHNINDFDFIDAPCDSSIESAIKNLIQLGAVEVENGVHKLTKDGRMLVKLGIEPRLGKMILKSFENRLGREGVILAAVMANSSSIFCRVGKDEEKQKSDCLKVQFCHKSGDLFTLLSVYMKWECVPVFKRNQWCWDNSINAKSMRRCQEAVLEMENCLQHEVNIIIPTYWRWNPELNTESDKILKNVILSALAENVAMYSGNDNLGYEVASNGSHVQLHPSCSLLIFGERPSWVVFGEIIAMPNQYLTCVTSIDFDSLQTLSPAAFDISQIDKRKLQMKVLTGFGTTLLKRICGKSNLGLKHLVSHIKGIINDDRIRIEVCVDRNEVNLFASSEHMGQVFDIVNSVLDREGKWLQTECFEKCLYPCRHVVPPVALFGSGGEIKHLELEKKCLTVDIFHHNSPNNVDEKELLSFLEKQTSGNICGVHRFNGIGQDNDKWGRVTFLTPKAAEKATKLTNVDFNGSSLKIVPSRSTYGGGDNKLLPFPAVKAKVSWPRRPNRGFAFVKCDQNNVSSIVEDFSKVTINGKSINCRPSLRCSDSVMLSGIDLDLFESELFDALSKSTNRRFFDLCLPRAIAVENPPVTILEETLLREINSLMGVGNSAKNECVGVHIFPPEPMDYFMKAEISFDGSLHLEAARALEQIDGKALAGCQPWQRIKCQQQFHSSVSCPASVYMVIKEQLDSLLKKLQLRKGAEFFFDRNENGSFRVKISAKATKIIAESRRPLEQLMNGRTIIDDRITPQVLQLIFSREGFGLQKSIQRETGTYFLFDRHNHTFRVFGPLSKLDVAQHKLINSLLTLHENKQLDVHLRGPALPPDLMKRVVEKFGPDLHGLKERFRGSDFTLNTRHHIISIRGSKELKQNVEETIHEIVKTSSSAPNQSQMPSCPICLCDVDDGYRLENCNHEFCRSCLVEQCESAIKSPGNSFPIRCAHAGCGAMILVVDLKSLLLTEKLDELFKASLGSFVDLSCGKYRFCPSPDCPSVYRVAEKGDPGRPFSCGACFVETCTRCHVEYHPFLSCEKYMEFKRDPDMSLKEWMKGKEDVKHCPVCRFTIEKIEGCNHVECRCGRHICWACLEHFNSSDECYDHLRSIHHAIV